MSVTNGDLMDFESLEEKAGHELTMVHGPLAGICSYYCENCGALVQMGGNSEKTLFHVPRGSLSTETRCVRAGTAVGNTTSKKTLKEKLQTRRDLYIEQLRREAMGDDE